MLPGIASSACAQAGLGQPSSSSFMDDLSYCYYSGEHCCQQFPLQSYWLHHRIMHFKDIFFIAWAINVGNETTQKGWDTVGDTGHSFGMQCDTRKRGMRYTRCTKNLGGTH